MKILKTGIILTLILGICLLTACNPKEDTTQETTEIPEPSVQFEEVVDIDNYNEFKEKYTDKMPGFNSTDDNE